MACRAAGCTKPLPSVHSFKGGPKPAPLFVHAPHLPSPRRARDRSLLETTEGSLLPRRDPPRPAAPALPAPSTHAPCASELRASRTGMVDSRAVILRSSAMPFLAVRPEQTGHSTGPGRQGPYRLDWWLGDDLIEAHPDLLVTDALRQSLERCRAPRGSALKQRAWKRATSSGRRAGDGGCPPSGAFK